jgi:DNA-binding MarR family transcriptional regulator
MLPIASRAGSSRAAANKDTTTLRAPARALALERFMPYRLSYTANLVSQAIAQQYGALFALSIPEWRVVAHVAEHSGITQQEIGLRTRMDKVTVSRATIALAARGLVSRSRNPVDRRARCLTLMPAGRRLYAAVAPKALELERAVFGRFSVREIATLTSLLKRIDAAALAAMNGRT